MTRARFEEIKQHAGQEYAGGLRTETIAAFRDLIADVEARGEFESETFDTATRVVTGTDVVIKQDDEPRRTSGARKK